MALKHALTASDPQSPLIDATDWNDDHVIDAGGITFSDATVQTTAAISVHNSLSGLTTGDPHTQYLLLTGRAGGQTAIGGTAASENLTLQSTSHATKGKIIAGLSAYDEANNYLGIRTQSPLAPLHLSGDVAALGAAGLFLSDNYRSTGAISANSFTGRSARGSAAAPTAVQTGDNILGIAARGYGATAFSTARGQIRMVAAENWTDAAQGTYYTISTTLIGTSTLSERMRILDNGNVGIGTTAPGYKLEVVGTARVSDVFTASTYISTPEIRLNGYSFCRISTNPVDGSPFVGYNIKNPSGTYQHDSDGNAAGFACNAGGIQIYTNTYSVAGTSIPSRFSFSLDGVFYASNYVNTPEIRLGGFSFCRMGLNPVDGGPFMAYNIKNPSGTYQHDSDGPAAGIAYNSNGIHFYAANSAVAGTTVSEKLTVKLDGKVGIGTTSPSYDASFGGDTARTLGVERHPTWDTAGNNLTVQAGGATLTATNKSGGQLILQGGISTGTGESGVTLQGYIAGSSGTSDCATQDMVKVLGNKIGFYNATPVVKPTALTTKLTTISYTAPTTPDYAIATVQLAGYGFSTADEGNTVLSVIKNLQDRVNDLETKLQALGLLT